MSDLVAFLRARAAEARDAMCDGSGEYSSCGEQSDLLNRLGAAIEEILARHVPEYGGERCGQCFGSVWHDPPLAFWPCDTVRALASVWSEHPDFDPAWKLP